MKDLSQQDDLRFSIRYVKTSILRIQMKISFSHSGLLIIHQNNARKRPFKLSIRKHPKFQNKNLTYSINFIPNHQYLPQEPEK